MAFAYAHALSNARPFTCFHTHQVSAHAVCAHFQLRNIVNADLHFLCVRATAANKRAGNTSDAKVSANQYTTQLVLNA